MKKQTVVLIWAAAVLLLVIACFGVYYFYDIKAEGANKSTGAEIFKCLPSEIEEYSVETDGEQYTLKRAGDGWAVSDKEITDLNDSIIEKMINSASNIVSVGTISRTSLNEFDAHDVRRLEIKLKERSNIKIRFLGSKDNLSAFKVEGDMTIYVMYASTRDILTPSLSYLRINEVFEGLSEVEIVPEEYTYTDYDGTVLEIRRKNANELAKSDRSSYTMVKPYCFDVNDEEFEQRIALKLSQIKINSFVDASNANLSQFGLDEASRATLSFTWGDRRETLYLGKNVGGSIYAAKANDSSVFTVNSSFLEFLQTEPFYLLEGSVLKSSVENISAVTIKTNNAEYLLEALNRNSDTDMAEFYINGKTASKAVFEALLAELDNMRFISEIGAVPQNTNDIQITVKYANAAGSQVISLARTDKGYAVFVDGNADFTVEGAAVTALLEKLKEAENNPVRVNQKGTDK